MGVKISVKDTVTPEGKELKRKVRLLCGTSVNVGFFGGRHFEKKNNIDVVKVAATNQYGTDKIPSRPFMSMSADVMQDRNADTFVKYAIEFIHNGGGVSEVFEKIGKLCSQIIREVIGNGDYVPLSPVTIARKGSSQPLIDTGTMKRSVEYEIKGKGGEGNT